MADITAIETHHARDAQRPATHVFELPSPITDSGISFGSPERCVGPFTMPRAKVSHRAGHDHQNSLPRSRAMHENAAIQAESTQARRPDLDPRVNVDMKRSDTLPIPRKGGLQAGVTVRTRTDSGLATDVRLS